MGAVDGVDLAVHRGETGATSWQIRLRQDVTALSVLKLIAMPPGRIVGGEEHLEGGDLVPLSLADMNGIRGKEIAMIFQEPMTSLNPAYTVGEQIAEVVRRHEGLGGAPPWTRRSRCCGWCRFPIRSAACTTIRISSPAGCASA